MEDLSVISSWLHRLPRDAIAGATRRRGTHLGLPEVHAWDDGAVKVVTLRPKTKDRRPKTEDRRPGQPKRGRSVFGLRSSV
ncbi:MAG: hypothetical protein ACREN6_01365 [Gemmatimonadaceae bacterium]